MDVEFELETMLFRWNAEKAVVNVARHGIHFEQAAEAFFDANFRLTDASRNDEARDALIGRDRQGAILFVVHIEMDSDAVRLISARRATATERKFYGDS